MSEGVGVSVSISDVSVSVSVSECISLCEVVNVSDGV